MDTIKTSIKTLICEDSSWILRLIAYPQKNCDSLTTEQLNFFKKLKETFDKKKNKDKAYVDLICSEKMYEIIKILCSSKGIRSIHPAWFFILKEYFEQDNFIFKIDDTNLNFFVPKDLTMPHRIQIIATLKIYYSLLKNTKIDKCFIEEDSEFILKYTEFKDIYKYLFFPIIEERNEMKFIDLSYDFNNIINSIKLEINEPHHDEDIDKMREQLIYFKTQNRIIHCYLSKDVKKKKKNEPIEDIVKRINNCINEIMPQVIKNYLFRLTFSIYNKNKEYEFAALTFNAFVRNIVANLSLALFFTTLKELSDTQELTWKLFRQICESVGIYISSNFIKLIDKATKNCDKKDKETIYKNMFYSFKLNEDTLNENTLLTENGFDYYLMKLTEEQCAQSVLINNMYSNYKIEYNKVMSAFLDEKNYENDMLKKQNDCDKDTRDNRIKELEDFLASISKGLKDLKK